MMTSADIDVEMQSKGIKIIVNPKSHEIKQERTDVNPLLNAFSDFFNDINNVREDIAKTSHKIQVVNKVLLRKLTKK